MELELAIASKLMKEIHLTNKEVVVESVKQTKTVHLILLVSGTNALTLALELVALMLSVKLQITFLFALVQLDTLEILSFRVEKSLLLLHHVQINVYLHLADLTHNVEKSTIKQFALVCHLILEALLVVALNVL
jgi:hypothetical protein